MTTTDANDADRALKARHRAVWASGDYARVADDIVWPLGQVLVDAVGVTPGDRVLDVAAGTGSAAIRAAQAGARTTASDLTPELFDAGRARAAQAGVELEWQEADAEALPYEDGSFDTVVSCIGVMFAPHHEAAADELVRVCRPGGRIGVLSWTPTGFIGRLFAALRPYVPPPPPGAQPPPLWGDEQHVRGLLGDRVTGVAAERRSLRVEHFAKPEEFRAYFAAHYGPTIAAYKGLAEDEDRTVALHRDLDALAAEFFDDTSRAMPWEYLLLTARRST